MSYLNSPLPPLIGAILLIGLAPNALWAQVEVAGQVRDASGGAIPYADVVLRNASDGSDTPTQTRFGGAFSFTEVANGSYQLEVSADGFSPQILDVAVSGQPVSLAVVLDVVSVSEQITVTASPDYGVQTSTTAAKMRLPILMTPRSISVIPSAVIQDQQAIREEEVLKNEASVTSRGSFLGAYESFAIRGFLLDNTANFLRDGRTYFRLASPPMETVERMEVLKGPESVLYGRGAPGGMINLVTKQPTATPYISAKFMTGSYDMYYGHLDLGGPIDKKGNFGYRTNFVYENSNSFRDFINVERRLASGGVFWNHARGKQLRFSADYIEDDRPQDTGLVAIGDGVAPIPRTRFLNNPWGHYDSKVGNIGAFYTAELGRSWKLDAGFNYQDFERDRYDQQPLRLNEETGDMLNRARRRVNRWDFYTYNVDLTGEQRFGNRRNTILIGMNLIDIDVLNNETQRNVNLPTNIFNPTYHPNPFIETRPDSNPGNDNRLAFYVQDAFEITQKLSVVGALGVSIVSSQFFAPGQTTPGSEFSDEALVPRVGLVYRVAPRVSTYVSYSESFEPNFVVTQGTNIGEQLAPTTGQQFEAGVKAQPNGRLTWTAAYFDLARQNIPFFDVDLDRVVERGEQVNRGFDTSFSGQITSNWTVIGSVMLLDAQFTVDPVVQGNRPAAVPKASGSLWSRYGFTRGFLRGVSVGGGWFGEGSRFGDDNNSFRLDSYSRLDLGLSYRLPIERVNVELQANIENLFDEEYFRANSRLSVFPGTPVSGRFGLRVWF
jgi:iron complex outermembrane recepter protein